MSERKMYNFPFVEDGQTYWRSRSCTVVGYVFCADKAGFLCVLANKRGPGAPTNVGKWNVPCGYIDFADKNGNEGVARETYEETGVKLKPEQFNFDSVSFSEDGDENINLRYWAKLAGTTDDYPLSNAANEEGETSDICWIRLCNVKNYEWAFGHERTILEMANHIEYTVDENGSQNVMPILVSVIETTTKKKKQSWLYELKFWGNSIDDWDTECYGRVPLAVCDTLDKCKEYVHKHLQEIIEIKKKDGFKLASDCENLVENLLVESAYLVTNIKFYKSDENDNFTEIVNLTFDFMPIPHYE